MDFLWTMNGLPVGDESINSSEDQNKSPKTVSISLRMEGGLTGSDLYFLVVTLEWMCHGI